MAATAFEINELIRRLHLEPHPEGGYYRRTWADAVEHDGRPASTAIIYLLVGGQRSHWHRIDAVELWHHYGGGPLELSVSPDGRAVETHLLGGDVLAGQLPQAVVPAGAWQSATALGEYALMGCTVTPGFTFDGFELAPVGWDPGE